MSMILSLGWASHDIDNIASSFYFYFFFSAGEGGGGMLVLAGCLLIVKTGCMGVHSLFCIQKSMSIQHRQTYRLLIAVFLTASFKDFLPLFYKMCFVVLPFLSLHSISMSKHLNITFFLKIWDISINTLSVNQTNHFELPFMSMRY